MGVVLEGEQRSDVVVRDQPHVAALAAVAPVRAAFRRRGPHGGTKRRPRRRHRPLHGSGTRQRTLNGPRAPAERLLGPQATEPGTGPGDVSCSPRRAGSTSTRRRPLRWAKRTCPSTRANSVSSLPLPDARARVEAGAPLAHDYRPRRHEAAVEHLDAQSLGVAVAAVAGAAAALGLGHLLKPPW